MAEARPLTPVAYPPSDSDKRWRRFNRTLIVAAVVLLLTSAASNLFIDPYAVFHIVKWKRSGYTDNERFNKIEHVIKRPCDYDAFVLGSSRLGLYDPSWFSSNRPGRRYYNLAVFGGHAKDALVMLAAIKAAGCPITEVAMGIDLIPFVQNGGEVTPAYKHHPRVTAQSAFEFYRAYVVVPSPSHVLLKLNQNFSSRTPDIEFAYFEDGRYRLPAWDERIAVDHDQYVREMFPPQTRSAMHVVWNERAFQDLKELVGWLRRENVTAFFFVDPHHHSHIAQFTPESLLEFQSRLEGVTGPIPTYMQHADWSDNDQLYYEPKHYRPELAKRIVRTLFEDTRRLARIAP